MTDRDWDPELHLLGWVGQRLTWSPGSPRAHHVLNCVQPPAAAVVAAHREAPLPAPEDLLFVFLVPCLNEERVIARSLERLLAVPGNFKVMVIDDASDDGTADVVRQFDPERVWLFQRTLPNAQKGKGEALNAAYRHLCASGVLGDRDPEDVIVAVLDADGRLAPNALIEVAPFFADPVVGGVQIGGPDVQRQGEAPGPHAGLRVRHVHGDLPAGPPAHRQCRPGGQRPVQPPVGPPVAGVGAVDQLPDRGSRSGHPVAHPGLAELLLPDHPCQPAGGG